MEAVFGKNAGGRKNVMPVLTPLRRNSGPGFISGKQLLIIIVTLVSLKYF